jgi:hypothetical protein
VSAAPVAAATCGTGESLQIPATRAVRVKVGFGMPLLYQSASAPGRAGNTVAACGQLALETKRLLRLALLAPDIVEAILEGRANQLLMLERLERPLPASWEEQREHLC